MKLQNSTKEAALIDYERGFIRQSATDYVMP
jgi:hypothetical protein